VLDTIGDLDRTVFQVQCGSCEELIAQEEEYCPSCGDKLPEGVFEEREQSPLGGFVESAIEQMGVNPVLARDGYDSWLFHKGSSEIRIFVYDNSYLFSTSPINLLPNEGGDAMRQDKRRVRSDLRKYGRTTGRTDVSTYDVPTNVPLLPPTVPNRPTGTVTVTERVRDGTVP